MKFSRIVSSRRCRRRRNRRRRGILDIPNLGQVCRREPRQVVLTLEQRLQRIRLEQL